MHAHPFWFFSWILPLNLAFSSIILLHILVHAFDSLKIPEDHFWTWGTLTKALVICLSILQGFFLLLCNFHKNLNIQNSWPHWFSNYSLQFSTGNHFIWSDQNPNFGIFVVSVIWSILKIAVLLPPSQGQVGFTSPIISQSLNSTIISQKKLIFKRPIIPQKCWLTDFAWQCLFGCQFLKSSMQWTGTGTVGKYCSSIADWTVSSYVFPVSLYNTWPNG